MFNAFECYLYNWSYLFFYQLVEVKLNPLLIKEELACLFVAHLVSFFMHSVVAIYLLDSIVRQVDERLVNGFLVDGEVVRGHSDVAFTKEIAPVIV